jgi:hypothetical protein
MDTASMAYSCPMEGSAIFTAERSNGVRNPEKIAINRASFRTSGIRIYPVLAGEFNNTREPGMKSIFVSQVTHGFRSHEGKENEDGGKEWYPR